MRHSLRQALFRVQYTYPNALEQQRATGLLWMNWALFGINILWLMGVIALFLRDSSAVEPQLWILSLFSIPLYIAIIFLIQRGAYVIAAWIMVAILSSIVGSQVPSLSSSSVSLLAMPIILAGLLLDTRSLLVTALLISLNVVRLSYLQSQQTESIAVIPAQSAPLSTAVVLISLMIITAFLYFFNNSTQRLARTSLNIIQQMRAIVGFQIGIETESDNAIYGRALRLITNQLGYSFAQIYTFDDYQRLNQQVRVSVQSANAIVTEDVRLDPQSNIIACADRRSPVITTRQSPAAARSHLLPGSVYSIAVPIVEDRRILAILDVQSEDDFDAQPDQIGALEALANQLARLIIHNRRIQSLQSDLQDQISIVSRLRARMVTLLESEQSNVNKAWLDYFQQQIGGVRGYDMRMGQEGMILANDLPETLRSALADGEVIFEETDEGRILSIPIIFRGQILGAMSFTIADGQPITERHMDMARNIANRLAIALENKRLFEQSQTQALREAKANEAARELLTSTDVQTVVGIAAEHFNAALGAIQTRIYIGQSDDSLTQDKQPEQEATA